MQNREDSLLKNLIRYIYRRRKTFAYLTIILLILSYAVLGKKGIFQRVELELENRALQEKLKDEKEKTLMYQKEIELLKTSEGKIEKVAREKYGMAKEGEEVYKVVIDSTK